MPLFKPPKARGTYLAFPLVVAASSAARRDVIGIRRVYAAAAKGSGDDSKPVEAAGAGHFKLIDVGRVADGEVRVLDLLH